MLIPDLGEDRGAIFSDDRRYRYVLWRLWKRTEGKYVAFIGLNPSTADETEDDPTVRRCINYAKQWGFNGMFMLNAFAFRATDPNDMMNQTYPISERPAGCPAAPKDDPDCPNDLAIVEYCLKSAKIIACWGNAGKHEDRERDLLQLFAAHDLTVECLGVTASNSPKHPLYLLNKARPVPFFQRKRV